jgi:ABC-type polysaccharide/polyol phosphate transport system ATPase subunit
VWTDTPSQRTQALQAARPAVVVEDVAKAFQLPHQHYSTLKERVLHPFASRSSETFQVLDDVSFHVQTGEFFGIVGRNGSGKSTLLKCLAGIYGIDKGAIGISGRVSPFIELGVGFNPDLTARDNVLINAIMLGLSRKEARRRFDAIIDFAELHDFVDLKLKNYSSGMSVRLGFSVAIQVDADVVLIDEVLAVGDAAFQHKCFDEFERMRAEGRTILFVTHDMASVERFCDRAMLIEKGRLTDMGAPDDISRRYSEVNFGQVPAPDAWPGKPGGEARIKTLWLEGPNGERAVTLAQGERGRAHIEVEFLKPVAYPAVSVIFRNEVRHTIFVASTTTHGPMGTYEPGDRLWIRLSFENWLAPSRYTLTPVITVWDPDERVIDQKADLASVIVEGPVFTGGAVDLPTELEIEAE